MLMASFRKSEVFVSIFKKYCLNEKQLKLTAAKLRNYDEENNVQCLSALLLKTQNREKPPKCLRIRGTVLNYCLNANPEDVQRNI